MSIERVHLMLDNYQLTTCRIRKNCRPTLRSAYSVVSKPPKSWKINCLYNMLNIFKWCVVIWKHVFLVFNTIRRREFQMFHIWSMSEVFQKKTSNNTCQVPEQFKRNGRPFSQITSLIFFKFFGRWTRDNSGYKLQICTLNRYLYTIYV